MPLYLSGAPLVCFTVSHLNVTTDIAGGAGLFIFIIGADDVEWAPFFVNVKLFVCISVWNYQKIYETKFKLIKRNFYLADDKYWLF